MAGLEGKPYDKSGTAWISQGFERLVERVRKNPEEIHFDVLIVGSGYGGSIAAATLAGRQFRGKTARIGVLERGKEYLPGSFPNGLRELPRYVQGAHNKEGLFDIRLGIGVTTVAANGVGGGSLINAGVMARPLARVFQNRWPQDLSRLDNWSDFFARAQELLGAGSADAPNTIAGHPNGLPQKSKAIQDLDPEHFTHAALTVSMKASTSSGNVELSQCKRCGDCATGCNFGAKNSLDVSLLSKAYQADAEIFSGATVLSVKKHSQEGWIVNAAFTNTLLRKRDKDGIRIRTRKLILAAGTLGSNEILMRSHEEGLPLSCGQLGQHCSTNGDMLVVDFATNGQVNTVADDSIQPSKRAIGPTITGIIDLRETEGVMIEEMSVPAGLRLGFAEIFATVNALHKLDEIDWSRHRPGFPLDDSFAIPSGNILNSALYAIMGDDGASGVIKLDKKPRSGQDGAASMHWAELPDLPLFQRQLEVIERITKPSGGKKIANPQWSLLPKNLGWLLQNKHGPLTTVHPLGGCAMADDAGAGVVNSLGQVFRTSSGKDVYPDLVVLDGSIIPTALGANPALTIAAVALRASEALASQWGFSLTPDEQHLDKNKPQKRPVFRDTDKAVKPARTEIEIVERLAGPVRLLPSHGVAGDYVAELTLRFKPKAIAELLPGESSDGTLTVSERSADPALRSRLRIYPLERWLELEKTWNPPLTFEQTMEAAAVFSAPLNGTLKVLERADSCSMGRIWRAGKAWLLNRGLRDIYQSWAEGDGGFGIWERIKSGIGVASKSGAVRVLTYDLAIGEPEANSELAFNDHRIVATKTFTYSRRGNPWRQLMQVSLERFPGMHAGGDRILTLDTGYLARIGIPLFRITKQSDGVGALAEIGAFLGYFLRLLLGHHIWSFRSPDTDIDPANDKINFRPPKELKLSNGRSVTAQFETIPMPQGTPELGDPKHKVDGEILITRYPQQGNSTKRPVVMLHGYSAGGTTFAHHAVNPNLASHLWETGRDIWIADLRTSPAHKTATEAWSFDQIGKEDVKRVIEHVSKYSRDGQVDVVAHCMGTIVFSIAMLTSEYLKDKVNRVAFTQVGPLVVFTPANVFRAYVVRYLIDFLPDNYQFNPIKRSLADDLWDRALSTLPYPVEEFDIENPLLPWKRTPWTRTRHRMDALYGRDFNVANMEPEMLRFIDEHFGSLSLKTVATTLHYVRNAMMTDLNGRNTLVSRSKLKKHMPFPIFSVHGQENGLAHVSTVDRMKRIMTDAGCQYTEPFINLGAGHQDSLIGTTRYATFEQIATFLDQAPDFSKTPTQSNFCAYPPWIGPILTKEPATATSAPTVSMRLGSLPSHREAVGGVLLRVKATGDKIERPDGKNWSKEYISGHMVLFTSTDLSEEGWDTFDLTRASQMLPSDAHPGNAFLVLLVYAEAGALRGDAERGRGYENMNDIVFDTDPPRSFIPTATRKKRGSSLKTEKNTNDKQRFDRAAKAVFEALALQQDSGESRFDILSVPVNEQREESREAISGPIMRLAENKATMFGRTSQSTTVALEYSVNSDRILRDGVIPYNPTEASLNDQSPEGTRFLLASCQYAAGFFDAPIAYSSYDRIAKRFESSKVTPRFMLFVGDQVYVDPTAGLYDPKDQDDRYRLPYENWLKQRSVRNVLRRAPSFMLLDDHEINDNWEPIPNDPENDKIKEAGTNAFKKYQRGFDAELKSFVFDGFNFFLLDTRTNRSHRRVGNLHKARLFSSGLDGSTNNMSDLKSWLDEKPGPKFVISPLMLLPRHRCAIQWDSSLDPSNLSALHSDSWDGYPNSLREVLGYIASHRIEQVVFLSGDEHRGCVASATLFDDADNPLTTIHSIHTSALYAPYPFANGVDEDIVSDEIIKFEYEGQRFSCKVQSKRPPPGDGCTFLSVSKQNGAWRLDCEFSGNARFSIPL